MSKIKTMTDDEFCEFVQAKRKRRMNAIDEMPQELRELVHDYGLCCVHALLDVGVTQPKRIRHVIETVLNEFSPTRGTFSNQGIKTPYIGEV